MDVFNCSLSAILIFCFINGYSQKVVSGKVIDEKTNEGISFATITQVKEKNGVNADARGIFKLVLTKSGVNDSLLFAALGYVSVRLAVRDLVKPLEIQLKEDVETLNEVNVTDKRSELKIGDYGSGTLGVYINNGGQVAKRFVMPANYQYLKEIWINRNLTRFPFRPETRFRINVFSENPETKGPGEKICLDTIEVHDIDNTEIKVDVSRYNISINSGPFFIGIETLPIPYNERYYLHRMGDYGRQDYPAYYQVLYQPILRFSYAKDNEGWTLPVHGSKWIKRDIAGTIKIIVN